MKKQRMTSKTGNATYCANCGKRPGANQRRVSVRLRMTKRGQRLMICSACAACEKRALISA